jgi:uncharacterized protein
MLNDSHCHFFSSRFFTALARQRGDHDGADVLCDQLQWDRPGTAEALADRWVRELDARGVGRAALIASVPGDEDSVATAVARHRSRLVGFFMVDPRAEGAVERVARALDELQLTTVCLFPAMHNIALDDPCVLRIVEATAQRRHAAVFVHCGFLSIGVRNKLGLPSRFDLRLGDPLAVARLASSFREVPFIIPHFGAGFFRETLMAADACPNIYLDTSSSNKWVRYMPGLTLAGAFEAALTVAGPSRLLFGSDSSFFPRGWVGSVHEAQAEALAGLGVAAGDTERIFGGNFDRLFPAAIA